METTGGIGQKFLDFLMIIRKEMEWKKGHDCAVQITYLKYELVCTLRKSYMHKAMELARKRLKRQG